MMGRVPFRLCLQNTSPVRMPGTNTNVAGKRTDSSFLQGNQWYFNQKITSKSLSSFQIANLQNCWCIPLRVHDQFLFFLPWTFLQRVITRYQFLGSQDVNSATDPEHGRFLEVMGRKIPLIYLLVGQGTLAGVGGQLVRRCPKS